MLLSNSTLSVAVFVFGWRLGHSAFVSSHIKKCETFKIHSYVSGNSNQSDELIKALSNTINGKVLTIVDSPSTPSRRRIIFANTHEILQFNKPRLDETVLQTDACDGKRRNTRFIALNVKNFSVRNFDHLVVHGCDTATGNFVNIRLNEHDGVFNCKKEIESNLSRFPNDEWIFNTTCICDGLNSQSDFCNFLQETLIDTQEKASYGYISSHWHIVVVMVLAFVFIILSLRCTKHLCSNPSVRVMETPTQDTS